MDKIFLGLINSATLQHGQKIKVVKMIEQSGAHPHMPAEVKALLLATLPYWLNTKSSLENVEICKSVFTSWSANNVVVMGEIFQTDLPGVIRELGESLDTVALCDCIATTQQIFKVAFEVSASLTGEDRKPQIVKSAEGFAHIIKVDIIKSIVNSADGVKTLSLIAAFLATSPEIVPWESPIPLIHTVIIKLSKPVEDISTVQPQEFIHHTNQVSRLIRSLWYRASTQKLVIVESLQLLFRIVSSTKELEDVSPALSSVLQSVPEVGIFLVMRYTI